MNDINEKKLSELSETVQSETDMAALFSEEAAQPLVPFPIPPIFLSASGLYVWTPTITLPTTPTPIPQRIPGPGSEVGAQVPGLVPIIRLEDLRLDVDRSNPQMAASGTIYFLLTARTHWIARLRRTGPSSWAGPIWYKDGNTSQFPYTNVKIEAYRSIFPAQRTAKVTFMGSGVPDRIVTYKFMSAYFHEVEFEFDYEQGITPVTEIDTHAHPNRPASLPKETLSIETVFQRSGFAVTVSRGGNMIPGLPPGPEKQWSDNEMHDAMQAHWSRFADRPQWALWTFFASQHEMGSSLGGIMFDDIGPNHRQGTALFYNSFISNPPANDPAPAAWVQRMRFWTAVHEMGHAFNLAHSWQKQLGTAWIPLTNEPEARSFMNYPHGVSGGQTAFFRDFEFRFSDAELL